MKTDKNDWLPSGGGVELTTIFGLYFLGLIFGAVAIKMFIGNGALDNVYNIRGANIIQAMFLFLIPTSIYGALFADKKGSFLVKHSIDMRTLLLGALTLFTILPFVETVNYYNELIPLPESLAEIARKSLEANQKAYSILFNEKTVTNIGANILTIAILPAVLEELFFRGCLQRSVSKLTSNSHSAIWITAIIFSLLHFQVAGFIPRIILGALLGYLYFWSKNIWVPIVVHAINNATVILVIQLFSENEFYKKIQITDYSLGNTWIITLISLFLTVGLMVLIYKLKPKETPDPDLEL